MSGGIVSFGAFTFPDELAEFNDNFADTTPQTARLPGLHGGYNQDGDGTAQTAVGKVVVGFNLVAQTRAAMDDLRDAVNAMVEYGLQQLTYQPTELTDPTRYCWARVNFISIPQRKDEHTDLFQKVTVTFQVADPHWYVGTGGPWQIGVGDHTLGEIGLEIGGGGTPVTINASGTSSNGTVTNAGNALSIPTISIVCSGSQTFVNPTIRRIKNGKVVDEVAWTGTIQNNGELFISGKTQRITYNSSSVFGANLSYEHPDFVRLEPGANSIYVLSTSAGSAATVTIWYADVYR